MVYVLTLSWSRHKHLMIKRSQRCRRCEHNLSKPEYNPTSIKFKIQLAAYYHVPEIVIYKVPLLSPSLTPPPPGGAPGGRGTG